MFSYLRTLTTWHCPHSPAARCCSNRLMACQPEPAGAGLLLLTHSGIDRQTDTVPFDRPCCAYLPTVILIITGIPSPTHSFTLGLNPSFSANPPYRSLSFFSFKIHYMDFPDCLLLLLSISVFLLFYFFLFLHFFSCRFRAVD